MFVFVHLFIISWERKSQTLCVRMHPNRWLRVNPQRTMVILLSLTHFVDITFRAHVSAPLTYHPCHLADKVRVWGQGDQTGDDVLRLHHHEPRLRRSNGASRQPQGSLQAHRDDGAQLRTHRRGRTAGCPAVRWLHSLIVLLFFVKFRGACRWLSWSVSRWSCTQRDSSPARRSPGRWPRCTSCALSSCPSRTTTTLAWGPSNPSWSWQGQRTGPMRSLLSGGDHSCVLFCFFSLSQ